MKCENLDVWKKSAGLSADIYLHLKELKDYGFKDQLTRSGLSIPSNIAEGAERISEQEKARFRDIARASSAEAATQIYIGMKIGYIDKGKGKAWIETLDHVAKMPSSLIGSIQQSKTTERNK
jgi:four helix bundle protein